MAIKFNGTTGLAKCDTSPGLSYPYWQIGYFSADSTSAYPQMAFSIGQSAADYYDGANVAANTLASVGAWSRHPGESNAATLSTTVNATLKLCIVVYVSASIRKVFYGSNTSASSTYNIGNNAGSATRVTIGGAAYNNSAGSSFLNGSVAEFWWGLGDLSADAASIDALLSQSMAPENTPGRIDGFKLTSITDLTSYTGTRTLTLSGSVVNSSQPHPIARASAATGVTLSGPSGGLSGAVSSNFSVGVSPAGGTITGTLIVTPSDGGAGGTFNPTTVSLTTASSTGTFTYTPASVGAKTISVTNNGSLTNPTSVTYTSQIVPVLTSASASATSSTSATWSVSTNESGGTLYRLVTTNATETASAVKVGNTSVVSSAGVQSGNSSTTLAASTTYYYHFVYVDGNGNESAVVNTAAFTTPAQTAAPPTLTGAVTASNVTSTGMTLSWSAATAGTNAVTGYQYSIDTGTINWVEAGAVTSVNIPSGLSPATTYALRVRAHDGSSNYSAIITGSQATSVAASGTITWPCPIAGVNGSPRTSAGHRIVVCNMTTDVLVVKKTGLTTDAVTGVPPAISDSLIVAGTQYRCHLILDSDNTASGTEVITAS